MLRGCEASKRESRVVAGGEQKKERRKEEVQHACMHAGRQADGHAGRQTDEPALLRGCTCCCRPLTFWCRLRCGSRLQSALWLERSPQSRVVPCKGSLVQREVQEAGRAKNGG